MKELKCFNIKAAVLWLFPGDYLFKFIVDGKEKINEAHEIEEVNGTFWNKIRIYPIDSQYNNYANLPFEIIKELEKEITNKDYVNTNNTIVEGSRSEGTEQDAEIDGKINDDIITVRL